MSDSAIILAGGFGTRLHSVVSDLPKPMADISGKPFLHYLLLYLKHFGVKNAILATGYLHEKIESYFGYNYEGINIQYSVETYPLGTGGAIKKALELVKGNCFILNGDSFIAADLNQLAKFHSSKKADFSIGLKAMQHFDRYGTVVLDKNRITAFKEKEYTESGLINTGIYITSHQIFDGLDLPENFSIEKDFLEKNLERLNIAGMPVDGYFIDIGIPEDYHRASAELPAMLKNFQLEN